VDAITAWGEAGRAYGSTATVTPAELAARRDQGEVAMLDVRGLSEWKAGHVPGVGIIPLGYLLDQLGDLPAGRPLVLHCQGGSRSLIAASLLEARGIRDVVNLDGGFDAWERAGLPVER
jgi:hydroxyacylglutathione hydrolase